jgi:hypothetical protein
VDLSCPGSHIPALACFHTQDTYQPLLFVDHNQHWHPPNKMKEQLNDDEDDDDDSNGTLVH